MESGMERAGSHSIYIHERKKCCSKVVPISCSDAFEIL